MLHNLDSFEQQPLQCIYNHSIDDIYIVLQILWYRKFFNIKYHGNSWLILFGPSSDSASVALHSISKLQWVYKIYISKTLQQNMYLLIAHMG